MNDGDGKADFDKPLDLRVRTRQFALDIIRLTSSLPKTDAGRVISGQLLRSGTSVGAQYREATRGRSTAKFTSKVEGALQELEESMYWMELIIDAHLLAEEQVRSLLSEADELAAILVTCAKNAKQRKKQSPP